MTEFLPDNNHTMILLVDDDIDEHEIFTSAVTEVSPETAVITAENGVAALNILLKQKISPEIIFLDINMPLMNGFQFLNERNKHDELKQIPVIMYSTTSSPEAISKAKQLGAEDFISKPENFLTLQRVLKSKLNKLPD